MLLINVNLELLLRAKNCSALFTFGLVFRHANIPSTYNLCIILRHEYYYSNQMLKGCLSPSLDLDNSNSRSIIMVFLLVLN
jgi:hypothetical protein